MFGCGVSNMGKHLKTLVKEKPEGATHFDKGFGFYLDCSDQFNIKKYVDGQWVECRFRSGGGRYIVYVGGE